MNAILWILAFVVFWTGCSGETSTHRGKTPVRVSVVQEYRGSDLIRYSAHVEPNHEVHLAFKVGGYITGLHQVRDADGSTRDVQSGDMVARGTALARLRKNDYETRVEQARASLEEAKASAEKADRDLERATKLFETQSMTKSEFDAATAAAQGAKARAEALIAQLQEAELSLRDADLVAPMDAIVISRSVETGDLASVGQSAFVLADTRWVKAVFGVPDVLIGRFRIGQPMTVILEAIPGVEFNGVISRISPAADSRTRLFETEVKIDNPRNRLRSGMIATIVVKNDKQSAPMLVVPLTSIVESAGKPDQYAVMVVEINGGKTVSRLRHVNLGETYGDMIQVLGGVQNNERVITTGATLVTDGEEVRIIP